MITLEKLQGILAQLPELRIGLVGDLFLDRYLELARGVEEYSIETGLEAYQIDRVRNAPGALGTVMNNLAALGVGQLVPITVIGDDGHGFDLLHELQKLPVDSQFVIRSSQRLTPTYTKPLRWEAGRWVELNRLDVRTRAPLSDEITERSLANLQQALQAVDGLIVLDQVHETDWGVVNRRVREGLIRLAPKHPEKLILVDSRAHLGQFDAVVLKGNRTEITAAASTERQDRVMPEEAAKRLAQRTGKNVYCTMGDEGLLIASSDGRTEQIPPVHVEGPVDIVGAGDSATSGLVCSLLCGASPSEAAAVANLIASITIQQLGTTGTASPGQVVERWHEWRKQHA